MRSPWVRRRRGEFQGQATGVLTADGHFLNASPSLAAFLHMEAKRLPGSSIYAWMDRDVAGQVAPRVEGVANGRASDQFQVRLLHDADPVWVSINLAPGGVDDDGDPLVVASFGAPSAA